MYLPFNDSQKSAEVNLENMIQAVSHIEASHEITDNYESRIIVGDLNYAPSDTSQRAIFIDDFLENNYCDVNTDLKFYSSNEYSHKSGRSIDRLLIDVNSNAIVENVRISKQHFSSDHFLIISKIHFSTSLDLNEANTEKSRLCWNKASEKAINAYSSLSHRLCTRLLYDFDAGKIDGPTLHIKTVENLELAASTCIPKSKPKEARTHDIPH